METCIEKYQTITKRSYLLYLHFCNAAWDAGYDGLVWSCHHRAYGNAVGEYHNPRVPIEEHEKKGIAGTQEEFMSLLNEMLTMTRRFRLNAIRKRDFCCAHDWADVERRVVEDIKTWEGVFDTWQVLSADVRGYMFLLVEQKKMGEYLLRVGDIQNLARLDAIAREVDNCKLRIKALKGANIAPCADTVPCEIGVPSFENWDKLSARVKTCYERKIEGDARRSREEFYKEWGKCRREFYVNPQRILGTRFEDSAVAHRMFTEAWGDAVLYPHRYVKDMRREKAYAKKTLPYNNNETSLSLIRAFFLVSGGLLSSISSIL